MAGNLKSCCCFIGLVLFCGCTLAKVNIEVIGERTALENQVLGTYNAIDRDMLLVASVRGVNSQGRLQQAAPQSRGHKDAIAAMQRINFHEDDIAAFKIIGWVGENREGLLTPFAMTKDNIPEALQEVAGRIQEKEMLAVIEQVNQARMVIMERVIFLGEDLSEEDLPEIQRIFGRLNMENAAAGEMVQQEDGAWKAKP